ncbi:MAG: DNA polymerase/3'-5' exonuclease PolX [Candidatus Micrarchaeia archaeon]|jgi:DNA polymerase (family 10)
MKNQEIANIFYKIADLLELKGVDWSPRAYRNAATSIEMLQEDIEILYKEKRLDSISGVGKSTKEKIIEYLETGKIGTYERLKKEIPVDFDSLKRIPSLGPKKIKILYEKLNITNLNELEKAVKNNKIKELDGFGEKSEEEILNGIQMLSRIKGRQLLGYVLPIANEIKSELKKEKSIKQIELVGSLRRMKETIGDIDILVVSDNPQKAMDKFTSLKYIEKIKSKGKLKSTAFLNIGIDCDFRIFNENEFGSAMMYFTGSKEHNIALRRIAMKNKLKLNEYGLFKDKKQEAGKTEKEVYSKLNLQYVPPELRENNGEIELAEKNKIPNLISKVYGDLQMHSTWSDGSNSIKEMALAAKKLGHKYILITDHSLADLVIAQGLKEIDFEKQAKEIDKVNKEVNGITVLKGVEANIRKDGSIDVPDNILKELDIVLGAVHSNFKMSEKDMTKRIMNAMENENVDIIAHPTGRVIGKRDGYNLNLDEIFEKAKQTNTTLEIDCYMDRLDLSADNIRRAIQKGVQLSIGTDSHSIDHLRFIELGIGTARKGWAQDKDIINSAKTVKDLIKKIKN